MAVSWVAKTTSLQNTSVSTVTFSHPGGTCDAICVGVDMVGVSQSVNSITWGGTAIPTAIGSLDLTGITGRLTVKGLAPAATGTNNVVVTLSASNASWDAIAITYLGAHQTGGTTTFNGMQSAIAGATSSPFDLSAPAVTTGAVGDMVQDMTISSSGNGDSTGTDWQDNSGSSNTQGKHYAGAASVTATESWDQSGANNYGIIAWNITQASAGAYDAATFQAMLMQTQGGAMIGRACRGVYG